MTSFSTQKLSIPTSREILPLFPVVKDTFWDLADDMSLHALIPFKSADKEDHHVYQTLFA